MLEHQSLSILFSLEWDYHTFAIILIITVILIKTIFGIVTFHSTFAAAIAYTNAPQSAVPVVLS